MSNSLRDRASSGINDFQPLNSKNAARVSERGRFPESKIDFKTDSNEILELQRDPLMFKWFVHNIVKLWNGKGCTASNTRIPFWSKTDGNYVLNHSVELEDNNAVNLEVIWHNMISYWNPWRNSWKTFQQSLLVQMHWVVQLLLNQQIHLQYADSAKGVYSSWQYVSKLFNIQQIIGLQKYP